MATTVQERTTILTSTLSTLLDGIVSARQGIQDVQDRKYRDVDAASMSNEPAVTPVIVEETLP